jgi:hypothetical protein
MAKKTVIVQVEFGVMDEAAISTVLDYWARATRKFGKCECFDLWSIEVDGELRDPDSPQETLW